MIRRVADEIKSQIPNPKSLLGLPRDVWLLGWVSLATDAATEAIYPLLPFFLTQVLGAGAVSLGIVEGAAEAVNSVVKIVSGRMADRAPRKRPLVLFGYGVSSAVRPLIAIATSWIHVFAIRLLDRLGKGIRSAPRDAMLAIWATPTTRGKVYGFHRAMDHLGAVVGPVLATLFLLMYPGRYRTLFALTIIPGAIAVILILFVREEEAPRHATAVPASQHQDQGHAEPQSSTQHGSALPRSFRSFMVVLTIFALGNSTDAFLLLKLTDAAGGTEYIPLMWSALHVVKASVSVIGGSWSDRVGRRTVIALGWVIYAIVYAGFATSTTLISLVAWFMLYGFYFGFAEGTEKALVADFAPASARGTAFGIYNAVTGVGALTASVMFGLIWSAYGATVAFGVGSGLAVVATALLFVAVPSETVSHVRSVRL